MTERKERRGLGRGLSALMAEVSPSATAQGDIAVHRPDMLLPIEQLKPNPDQPRRHFASEALEELAASIREKGVIQPLIVRPGPEEDGSYQIVAGERRWRAAQMAQRHEVPVVVRNFSDTEVLEIAIIENIQRADLNALEEALGYRQLMERFGHTQERVAEALGKSRSHIANLLRLLQLPDSVQEMVRTGALSAGHARALITASDPAALARQVVDRSLSVRQAEALARQAGPQRSGRKAHITRDADTRALEQDLSAALGMSVVIDHRAGGDGRLTIRYRNLDDLDALCRLLGHKG